MLSGNDKGLDSGEVQDEMQWKICGNPMRFRFPPENGELKKLQ